MGDIERFTQIEEKIKTLSNRKIRVEERYNNEKARLEKLLEEIKQKGFDPKNLSSIKDQKVAEFRQKIEELEAKAASISKALDAIEA